MLTRIGCDKIIKDGALFSGYVYLEDGRISRITKELLDADVCYDITGKYLSAGFIDMHTHGAGGYDFAGSSPEEVALGCDFHAMHGTTSILPTVSASAFGDMKRSLANIAAAKDKALSKSNIIGAHLEGPYLSREQCGAQCPTHITPPAREEYEALVSRYGGYIARWTYAPENDEGGVFCRYISERGILPSVGHSNAKYPDMKRALDSGARLITHLYSATSTVTRDKGFRSLGVIESAFLLDGYDVEIIADGKHLPPELINMIIKIKGADKVALVTDSLFVAGSDIKSGNMCGTDFIVEGGVARLPDLSAFAGSVATADVLIRTLTKECGVPLTDAVKMLTETPARILGLGGTKGRIAEGLDADLIAFDEDINVECVFVNGKKVI